MDEQEQPLTKQQRRKLKKEQKQSERGAMQRKKLMKNMVGYVAGFAGVLTVIWGGLELAQKSDARKPGERVASQGNRHIELGDDHIAYNTTPPTSGPHAGTARWGTHSEQIPDENQIHNLEDGGVGIQYNCDQQEDSCQDLVEKLNGLMKKSSDKVFMGPYSGIGNRIALTAWQRIDKFDEFDEQRILTFIEAYRGIDHHVRVGG